MSTALHTLSPTQLGTTIHQVCCMPLLRQCSLSRVFFLCRYSEIQQRVLLVTGDGDLLIPSSSEGPRLEKAIPRCTLRVGSCCSSLQKLQHVVLTLRSNILLH